MPRKTPRTKTKVTKLPAAARTKTKVTKPPAAAAECDLEWEKIIRNSHLYERLREIPLPSSTNKQLLTDAIVSAVTDVVAGVSASASEESVS